MKKLNIQEFSKQTGVPKSTLRFYETKGLLEPFERGENNYRYYAESQIEQAKLINSLRLEEIPISDIKQFLKAHHVDKKQMIEQWIVSIQRKQQLLSLSLQYLQSLLDEESVYLMEKPGQQVIWFSVEGKEGQFGSKILEKRVILNKLNIPIADIYIKYLSGTGQVKVKIGFGLTHLNSIERLTEKHEIESVPETLCIGLPFRGPFNNIRNGYLKLMNYAVENQLIPTSGIIEWYRGGKLEEADLILPIMKIEGG